MARTRILTGSPAPRTSRTGRVVRAWRALPPERRLAATTSIALFFTLFLPWYRETVVTAGKINSVALTGWNAFSFVEAAVLVVAAAVLTLLFERAEGRAFHLPGGDGWVVTAAGLWTCVLVVWRILDKQGAQVTGPGAAVSGVEWGIFIALAVAAGLAYAGNRMRTAATPEPPLPEDDLEFGLPSPRRPNRRPARPARPAAKTRGSAEPRAATSAGTARGSAEPRPPRRRTRTNVFPVPEPLADPPTLRFGDRRPRPAADSEDPTQVATPAGPGGSPAVPAAEAPTQATDDQLTIPFDDADR